MTSLYKKSRKNIPPNLRKQVWDVYIGIGIQSAPCPLCGVRTISSKTNSGFEAAHIVADKFLTEELSALYLFPSCDSCNNECAEQTILDYLWCRGRINVLKKLLIDVFNVYSTLFPDELSLHKMFMFRVIDHLYGPSRFKAGGGIINTKQIYNLCKTIQFDQLVEESKELSLKLSENALMMNELIIAQTPVYLSF